MADILNGMRVFVAVVETGSFSSAADRLGLSRGMTSRHVAHLEDHLGVRLLNRTTRRLSLTGAGHDYFQRAVHVIELIEQAEVAASSESVQPRGLLRINAPVSFSSLHLGQAVTAYLQRHPSVEIDLSLADREVNLVEEGFDLVLRISDKVEPMLIARPLSPIRVIICASPDYLATHGCPERPEDLVDHSCLSYARSQAEGVWRLQGADGSLHVEVAGKLKANNGDVLCNAAVAGLGIVAQPTFMLRHLLDSGALQRILPEWQAEPRTLNAVYADRRFQPLKIRSFIDFLVEYYKGEPRWDEGIMGRA